MRNYLMRILWSIQVELEIFKKLFSFLKDLLPDDDADEEGSKVCINDADKKWHDNGLENTGLETADDRNWNHYVQF